MITLLGHNPELWKGIIQLTAQNLNSICFGTSPGCPVVRTLPSNAGSVSSIPGLRAQIPHALWPKIQNIKWKPYCNKFNKDFKNDPYQKKSQKKKNLHLL